MKGKQEQTDTKNRGGSIMEDDLVFNYLNFKFFVRIMVFNLEILGLLFCK